MLIQLRYHGNQGQDVVLGGRMRKEERRWEREGVRKGGGRGEEGRRGEKKREERGEERRGGEGDEKRDEGRGERRGEEEERRGLLLWTRLAMCPMTKEKMCNLVL